MIVPVVLAGGSGTRLWPLSRRAYPKQLLPLVSPKSMLQETLLRVKQIPYISAPLVICNQDHRFLVAEQLKEIGMQEAKIIIEPVGRNTAPPATIAALYAKKHYSEDAILFILPSDHVINNDSHFVLASMTGYINAMQDKLVTFGVKPTAALTGYGYIKSAVEMNEYQAHTLLEFVEKPKQELADYYVASKQYYWNSGMFMFKASVFLHELTQYESAMLAACRKSFDKIQHDLDFARLDPYEFEFCPNNSIDYAVMEKTKNAVVVPLYTEWNDVGSWAALWESRERDNNNNVTKGDVLTHDVTNSYLRAESRMLVVMGVKDIVVVETGDSVLVVHKDHSQSVKDIVERLKKEYRMETDSHPKVYRPWGCYETIDTGNGYQVKRITVKAGASLSLQSHEFRSEHWVVVKGLAEVTCGEDVSYLKENQSTYIPKGIKHRLSNAGQDDLEIIEVQSGSYLGEDDIVRYDDVYGRLNLQT